MRKQHRNQWLNFCCTFLSVLVFAFSGIAILDVLNAPPSEEAQLTEANFKLSEITLSDDYYVNSENEIAQKPNLVFTTNDDGSFGQDAVLEALEALKAEISGSKDPENGFAYSVTTSGEMISIPEIAQNIFCKITTSNYAETDLSGKIYIESGIYETTNLADDARNMSKLLRDKNQITYMETTKVGLSGKTITSDFSNIAKQNLTLDQYKALGKVTPEVFDVCLDYKLLNLNACKLERVGAGYRLTIDVSRKALSEDEAAIKKGGEDQGAKSVVYSSYVVTIAFSKQGRISSMIKNSKWNMEVTKPFPTSTTTTRSEFSTFRYLPKDYTVKAI